nr:unnamed protein product [Callosobruchus analis]
MSGSGLKKLLSTIYAPVFVDKMMSGYAYSRAVRGHLLVHLALGKIIENVTFTEDEKEEIDEALDSFNDGHFEQKTQNGTTEVVRKRFANRLILLEGQGSTSKLWIQYFKMVALVKQFIEAERTGNWE